MDRKLLGSATTRTHAGATALALRPRRVLVISHVVAHEFIRTNGVTLHAVSDGPKDAPLIVLLHGFPDFWYGWRKQIAPLAAAGHRVLVPDQRGYGASDKPDDIGAYRLDVLAEDIAGLIQAAGRERAIVVGHDFGAAVAWWLAIAHPERVEKLVAINVPHPYVMRRSLLFNPRQLRKSWYMLFFQLPLLPERIFAKGGRQIFDLMLTHARPGAFSEEDLSRYREAWAVRGAAQAMINWYRAIPRMMTHRLTRDEARIECPTLVVWGKRDHLLGEEMAPPSIALCSEGRLEIIPEGTHWVHLEEFERVTAAILDFCRGDQGRSGGPPSSGARP